jgi:phosphoglucomutase
MDAIRKSGIHLGVAPLGGAGAHYWEPIAARYGLNPKVMNDVVDPTFRFMTLDWDGRIRMDPFLPYATRSLTALKDEFDIAFACDTDHDRNGIVTKTTGLLPPKKVSVARNICNKLRRKLRPSLAVYLGGHVSPRSLERRCRAPFAGKE